ncbi:hypothetical protein DFH09DRAFT_1332652 [Mycena vulgaris]|nr:hypothetical protein DFH09DRAFT_1332652 [Mycena vulgaris]
MDPKLIGVPIDPTNTVAVPPNQLAEQQRYVDVFDRMMVISPDSLEVLRELFKDNDQWARIVQRFRKAATSARQNDTGGLKHKLDYLVSDPSKSLVPAIRESASKSDRGVNHPMLHDAIVSWPLRMAINARDTTDNSEESDTLSLEAVNALKALMKGKLITGKAALTAAKYPSCFYADDMYNPTDPEKGLFRSKFLLRVIRHIWTTPSSVMDGADTLKKVSNARAHSQFRMNGRMIGYGCSQARTLISTSDWTAKDGSYNYEKLFNAVVALFEDDPTDPWVIDTLTWYQERVFGCAKNSSDSGDDKSDSENDGIAARRAARRSAASGITLIHFPCFSVYTKSTAPACAVSCFLRIRFSGSVSRPTLVFGSLLAATLIFYSGLLYFCFHDGFELTAVAVVEQVDVAGNVHRLAIPASMTSPAPIPIVPTC